LAYCEDPIDAIWEKELVPLLEQESQLTGLTLWEYLENKHATFLKWF
jgi:hypothetical protein